MNKFLRDLARARFLGHPIHVMLIHFPAALFPFGFLMDVLAVFVRNETFAAAACYSYAGGVVLGCLAALFGAIDYFRIPAEEPAWKIASLHALLNGIWIGAFAFICGVRLTQFPDFAQATMGQLVTVAVCVLGMAVSNHLGGELVFRFGLGASHRNNREATPDRSGPAE